ncbi:MAG: MFS transporter [Pseudomonadota bacterium]
MIGKILNKLNFPRDSASWKTFGVIFSLQAAHELPNALTSTMAPTLFVKQYDMPLGMIGLFFLPFVVTALKWTWAPLVDNRGSVEFGRRKSWIAPLTILVALSYFSIALIKPGLDTLTLIVGFLIVKQVFYSTQEIAADAYVVENLKAEQRGLGSSIVWMGKEAGQIIGFAGLLFVADRFGWTPAFFLAGILFIAFNIPAILRKERPVIEPKPSSRAGLRDFFKRKVNYRIVAIVFAISFTVQMPVTVIGPFLNSKGLSLSQIGVSLGVAASIGALISLSIASVVISKFGPKRTAIFLMFVAPLAAPAFIWLAMQETVSTQMVILILLWATLCTAPIRMAVYAARIGWTSEDQVGTDITIQQSTWFLGYAAAGAVAGLVAEQMGWVFFFVVNVLLIAAALLFFIHSHDQVEEDIKAWRKNHAAP